MSKPVRLCAASELAEGHARGFPSFGVFVLRRDGRVHGWRDACPHYGNNTPLAWKRDAYLNADGSRIVCAAHGAQFEPDTGRCTLGACLGQSLTRVAVWQAANGDLIADVGADGTDSTSDPAAVQETSP